MAFIIIIYKNNNIFIFISNKVNIFILYCIVFFILFNRSAQRERKINLTDVVYFGMFAITFIAYFYCIFQVKNSLYYKLLLLKVVWLQVCACWMIQSAKYLHNPNNWSLNYDLHSVCSSHYIHSEDFEYSAFVVGSTFWCLFTYFINNLDHYIYIYIYIYINV